MRKRFTKRARVSARTPTESDQKPADISFALQDSPKRAAATAHPDGQPSPASFPVVGIGASAGGLEAFTQLFQNLPADTGMAFVLVQHLDPKHHSMLTELIARATPMPVREVTDGMRVAPDNVYVIPPNADLEIQDGALRTALRKTDGRQHHPADSFFTSLAQQLGNRAIGVVLSGSATDGAEGIKTIRAEGGITFAQDQKSAKYDGMPNAAVAAGVDYVLPPDAIARELTRISRHPAVNHVEVIPAQGPSPDSLNRIFMLLRGAGGVDFSLYKPTTVKRRILRRMVLDKHNDLDAYIDHLRKSPAALAELHNDLLINVTGFFRDPESFVTLKEKVFPHIMQQRQPNAPIRIWVPGCSSGEEVYSIAIALFDFLGAAANETPVQVFGTDVNERAITRARTGVYPEAVVHDVSPERLRRFFHKGSAPGRYQVAKSIREACVFAQQNLVKDPPFSHLDLISCRNVLIYFGSQLQKQIIPIFHYALNPNGVLMLGGSETLGQFADHFDNLDRRHKTFIKKPGVTRISEMLSAAPLGLRMKSPTAGEPKRTDSRRQESDDYSAAVVVDSQMQVLQFRGQTHPYLEFAPGQATLDLSKIARPGLREELAEAFRDAVRSGQPAEKESVWVKAAQGRHVNIRVIPQEAGRNEQPRYLIAFEDARQSPFPERPRFAAMPTRTAKGRKLTGQQQVAYLNRELANTREYLQSVIEEQESSNEELKSANEEILSSNEELQSTNEELETAKEELQSTNEELTTVNEELQNRNTELLRANSDMSNLLSSINIPIIMLGQDLCIRHFTPQARKALNLIPSDIGRPIGDIKLNINLPNLEELIVDALDTITHKEVEVQDRDGRWYSLSVRPYKTSDHRIDGAIVVLLDIDAVKRSERQAAEAGFQPVREELEAAVARRTAELEALTRKLQEREARLAEAQSVANVGSWNWDPNTAKLTWSDELYRITGVEVRSGVGLEQAMKLAHSDDRQRIQAAIEQARKDRKPFAFQARLLQPGGLERSVLVHGHVEATRGGQVIRVFGTVQDITSLKRAEDSLRELSGRLLRLQDEERRHMARELHDSTAQSLAALSLNLASLAEGADGIDPAKRNALFEAQALAEQCSREIRTMSYLLHPPLLDEAGLVPALKWYVEGFEKRSGVTVKLTVPAGLARLHPDIEITVFRVIQEALANVHRHSGCSTAEVELDNADGSLRLEVRDDGRGIDAERLNQASVSLGVGILGMRERVRQLGGSLVVLSQGHGTTVRAVLQAHPPEPQKAQAEHAS